MGFLKMNISYQTYYVEYNYFPMKFTNYICKNLNFDSFYSLSNYGYLPNKQKQLKCVFLITNNTNLKKYEPPFLFFFVILMINK